MNTKLVISLLFIVLLFAACGTDNDKADNTKNNPIENDISRPDNSITMILCKSVWHDYDDIMAEYAEKLLAEAGWNVDIKFYDINYVDRDERKEKYLEQLREEMVPGENVIFELRYGIDELIADDLIYSFETEEDEYYLKIGNLKSYYYTGVYIKKEFEYEYGGSITSTEEYDAFLEWINDNHKDVKPGLMIIDDTYTERFAPLALFAQESGFVRADKAVGTIGYNNTMLYIDMFEIGNSDTKAPMVYQATEPLLFSDMDIAINKWKNERSMEFADFRRVDNFTEYASIVMNTSNTTNYYSYNYQRTADKLFDASNYNLHIFTKNNSFPDTPRVTNYGPSSGFAVSSKSNSITAINEFFDWIYSSKNNYLLFMFGKEGIDYIIEDGKIKFLVNDMNISYGEWHKHSLFIDSEMNIDMPHFPANWHELEPKLLEVKRISIVDVIGRNNIDFNLSEVVNETVFNDELMNSFNAHVTSLYVTYFSKFTGGDRVYTAEQLKMDVESSERAELYKKAYEKLYEALRRNAS